MGFKGYVQSDFFAVKSTVAPMLAGLDHLMPVPSFWAPALLNAALAAGQLKESDFDRALMRRYTQMFRMGIFERQPLVQTPIDFAAGGAEARAIGVQSAVLLQNDNRVLPFDAKTLAATKEQFDAIASFWDETLGKGASIDKFHEAAKALQEKLRDSEKKKAQDER